MTPKQIFIAIFLGLLPYLIFFGTGQFASHCLTQEFQKSTPALMSAGTIIFTVGRIWLIVQAFRNSVAWGAAVIFLPLADGFFSEKFWEVAKVPFCVCLVGYVLFGLTVPTSCNTDAQKQERMQRNSSDTKLKLRQKRTGFKPAFKLDNK